MRRSGLTYWVSIFTAVCMLAPFASHSKQPAEPDSFLGPIPMSHQVSFKLTAAEIHAAKNLQMTLEILIPFLESRFQNESFSSKDVREEARFEYQAKKRKPPKPEEAMIEKYLFFNIAHAKVWEQLKKVLDQALANEENARLPLHYSLPVLYKENPIIHYVPTHPALGLNLFTRYVRPIKNAGVINHVHVKAAYGSLKKGFSKGSVLVAFHPTKTDEMAHFRLTGLDAVKAWNLLDEAIEARDKQTAEPAIQTKDVELLDVRSKKMIQLINLIDEAIEDLRHGGLSGQARKSVNPRIKNLLKNHAEEMTPLFSSDYLETRNELLHILEHKKGEELENGLIKIKRFIVEFETVFGTDLAYKDLEILPDKENFFFNLPALVKHLSSPKDPFSFAVTDVNLNIRELLKQINSPAELVVKQFLYQFAESNSDRGDETGFGPRDLHICRMMGTFSAETLNTDFVFNALVRILNKTALYPNKPKNSTDTTDYKREIRKELFKYIQKSSPKWFDRIADGANPYSEELHFLYLTGWVGEKAFKKLQEEKSPQLLQKAKFLLKQRVIVTEETLAFGYEEISGLINIWRDPNWPHNLDFTNQFHQIAFFNYIKAKMFFHTGILTEEDIRSRELNEENLQYAFLKQADFQKEMNKVYGIAEFSKVLNIKPEILNDLTFEKLRALSHEYMSVAKLEALHDRLSGRKGDENASFISNPGQIKAWLNAARQLNRIDLILRNIKTSQLSDALAVETLDQFGDQLLRELNETAQLSPVESVQIESLGPLLKPFVSLNMLRQLLSSPNQNWADFLTGEIVAQELAMALPLIDNGRAFVPEKGGTSYRLAILFLTNFLAQEKALNYLKLKYRFEEVKEGAEVNTIKADNLFSNLKWKTMLFDLALNDNETLLPYAAERLKGLLAFMHLTLSDPQTGLFWKGFVGNSFIQEAIEVLDDFIDMITAKLLSPVKKQEWEHIFYNAKKGVIAKLHALLTEEYFIEAFHDVFNSNQLNLKQLLIAEINEKTKTLPELKEEWIRISGLIKSKKLAQVPLDDRRKKLTDARLSASDLSRMVKRTTYKAMIELFRQMNLPVELLIKAGSSLFPNPILSKNLGRNTRYNLEAFIAEPLDWELNSSL